MSFLAALAVFGILTRQSIACSCHLQRDGPEHDEMGALAHRAGNCAPQTRFVFENVHISNGFDIGLPRSLCIENGFTAEPSCSFEKAEVIDGGGSILLPGLIDVDGPCARPGRCRLTGVDVLWSHDLA